MCVHSSWAPLPFVLTFCIAFNPGEGCISLTVLEDSLGWEIPQTWHELSTNPKHLYSQRFHGSLGSLGSEWSGMPLGEILHLLAKVWLEFLFYFLFCGAVTLILCFTSSVAAAGNKMFMEKGYDIKIWCSGQSCQELKHNFHLPSAMPWMPNDFQIIFSRNSDIQSGWQGASRFLEVLITESRNSFWK